MRREAGRAVEGGRAVAGGSSAEQCREEQCREETDEMGGRLEHRQKRNDRPGRAGRVLHAQRG